MWAFFSSSQSMLNQELGKNDILSRNQMSIFFAFVAETKIPNLAEEKSISDAQNHQYYFLVLHAVVK